MTGLCYSQTMPMIWRTLFVIHSVNESHHTHLGIPEVAQTYHLRSHGSNYFLFKIKPKRKHLVLCATQNNPNWKERFFFVDRRSLPDEELIPTFWLTKAVFENLAPPLSDTEELIQKFLQVPENVRTFSSFPLSEIMKTEKTTPSSAASYFSLSDIDDEDISIKEEKSAPESSKAKKPNPRTRSTVKKRKAIISEDPDEPILDFGQAMEQATARYKEKEEMIESIKKSAAVAAESAAQKIASLRKEVKDAETYAAQKDIDAQKRIDEEREAMIAVVKKDAAAAVQKARNLMASEASAKGSDTSFWNLKAWQEKLAKLKSENPEMGDFLDGSNGKALKPSPNKASKVCPQKAAIQVDDAEMDDPESMKEIPEESTPAEESNIMGEEGK